MLCLLVGYVMHDSKVRAQGGDPASIMELIRSLEMSEEQEKLRIESQARFKQLSGEELRAARETFQAERKAAFRNCSTMNSGPNGMLIGPLIFCVERTGRRHQVNLALRQRLLRR